MGGRRSGSSCASNGHHQGGNQGSLQAAVRALQGGDLGLLDAAAATPEPGPANGSGNGVLLCSGGRRLDALDVGSHHSMLDDRRACGRRRPPSHRLRRPARCSVGWRRVGRFGARF